LRNEDPTSEKQKKHQQQEKWGKKASVKIESGADFTNLIDSSYRCDEQSTKKIKALVTFSEAKDLLLNDDSFFSTAAGKLSFYALAYLINLGVSPIFKDKFTLEGKVLPVFFTNLENRALEVAEKKRILSALMVMNFEETQKAIENSRYREFLDLFYELRTERKLNGEY